jgi:hypothetical protein
MRLVLDGLSTFVSPRRIALPLSNVFLTILRCHIGRVGRVSGSDNRKEGFGNARIG